jgi:hypothetical protein
MKKRNLMAILLIAVFALIVFVVSSYSQEDVTTVNDSAFEKHMRPAVPFSHDEHNEKAEIEECNECHHVYTDGKRVEDESSEDSECSECHASEDDGYPISLVKAYHINCKGCHLEKKAGPVMCAECHPRK